MTTAATPSTLARASVRAGWEEPAGGGGGENGRHGRDGAAVDDEEGRRAVEKTDRGVPRRGQVPILPTDERQPRSQRRVDEPAEEGHHAAERPRRQHQR